MPPAGGVPLVFTQEDFLVDNSFTDTSKSGKEFQENTHSGNTLRPIFVPDSKNKNDSWCISIHCYKIYPSDQTCSNLHQSFQQMSLNT